MKKIIGHRARIIEGKDAETAEKLLNEHLATLDVAVDSSNHPLALMIEPMGGNRILVVSPLAVEKPPVEISPEQFK